MASYTDFLENRYPMGGSFRGKLVVIDNEVFSDPRHKIRNGTEKDVERLKTTFGQLGFEVDLSRNQTAAGMLQIMIRVASCGLNGYDCLAIAILTHGVDNGLLAGTGAPAKDNKPDVISLDKLFLPLKNMSDGKPKLIFIQACRGYNLDEGRQLQHDGTPAGGDVQESIKVPMESDFLYHFSTSPGYFSFRNPDGTIFIQALCDVLDLHIQQNVEMDLLKCLTRVNRKVAEKFESNAKIPEFSGKKQMPSIVSMLRKDVFLQKKP